VQIVISAVTASSSAEVADKAAKSLRAGQVLLDINSVSPARKIVQCGCGASGRCRLRRGRCHGASAATTVASTHASRRQAGKRACSGTAQCWDEYDCIVGADRPSHSAVKMCRSIVIKGLEALTVESMLAARRFGRVSAKCSSR